MTTTSLRFPYDIASCVILFADPESQRSLAQVNTVFRQALWGRFFDIRREGGSFPVHPTARSSLDPDLSEGIGFALREVSVAKDVFCLHTISAGKFLLNSLSFSPFLTQKSSLTQCAPPLPKISTHDTCVTASGLLICVGPEDSLQGWENNTRVFEQTSPQGPISAICLSSDSQVLVCASVDQTIRFLNLSSQTWEEAMIRVRPGEVPTHLFTQGDWLIGTPRYDSPFFCIWNKNDPTRYLRYGISLKKTLPPKRLPHTSKIAIPYSDGKIAIWDLETNSISTTFVALSKEDTICRLHGIDQENLLCHSRNGHLEKWKINDNEPHRDHCFPKCSVFTTAFHETLLLTAHASQIHIWDLMTNGLLQSLDTWHPIKGIALGDKGRKVVAVSCNNWFMWDLTSLSRRVRPCLRASTIASYKRFLPPPEQAIFSSTPAQSVTYTFELFLKEWGESLQAARSSLTPLQPLIDEFLQTSKKKDLFRHQMRLLRHELEKNIPPPEESLGYLICKGDPETQQLLLQGMRKKSLQKTAY